ncbi:MULTISPECIES: hypothetical protein [Vibrio]|uniref:hypothetical protein n=1 Tax=Vibrio TaxID=662 RepID=UPI0018E45B07|nr:MULTISPECIES: hypothetical protein [Vibrio]CAK3932580.1 Holin [Vibrio crassostreae]
MPMQKVLNTVSEWKGRLIAYGGGTGVSAFSAKSTAKAQELSEHAAAQAVDILSLYIFPGVTVGAAITIVGALVVVLRLIFDVWKYFDQRKRQPLNEGV